MAESEDLGVGALSGRIEFEDYLSNGLIAAGEAVGRFQDQFTEMGTRIASQAASFFTAEVALEAIKEATHELIAEFELLTLHGSVVEDISNNYAHLTENAGLLGETLLSKLKSATNGTVDDFQLMKRVNQDLAAGLHLTDDQFSLLGQGAYDLSRAYDINLSEALDKVSNALVTGRTKGVAFLTGKLDLKKVEEEYATSLGHTVSEMSSELKLSVDRQAMLDKIAQTVGRIGEQHDTLKIKVQQAAAAWANFEDETDKAVSSSPVLLAGIKAVGEEIVHAFGPSQKELIQLVRTTIDSLAIAAVDVAKVVVSAGADIAIGWYAVKKVFGDTMQIVDGVHLSLLLMDKALINIGLHTKSGSELDQLKLSWQANDNAVTQLAVHMKERGDQLQADSAAQANVTTYVDKANDALERVRASMIKAKASAEDLNKPVKENADAHSKAAAAAGIHAAKEGELAGQWETSKSKQKEFTNAWEQLNSIGETYLDTVKTINPEILKQVEYYLRAGAAVGIVTKAYPTLTEAQVKAVETMIKQDAKWLTTEVAIAAELRKVQDEYLKAVEEGDHNLVQKQITDAYLVADIKIAAMTKSKNYSIEAEMTVWATADQVAKNIIQRTLEQDATTKEHYQLLRDVAKSAFEFAQAHMESYTEDQRIKLRQAFDEAQAAVDGWGQKTAATFDNMASKANATANSIKSSLAGAFDPNFFVDPSQLYVDPFLLRKNIPLPGRATGGPVKKGQLYAINERTAQSEFWRPDSDGTVMQNSGNESGGTRTVNVYMNVEGVWDPSTVRDMTGRIKQELGLNQRQTRQLPA